MDNKELKEKIVSIIKANSYLEAGYKHSNGTISREGRLHEEDFENVAEEIVNLLPIQIVSCSGVCDGKCIINNTTNMCIRCGKEYNENNCN